jgi:hypothetical protein
MSRDDVPALRAFDDELTSRIEADNAARLPGNESTPGGPWVDDGLLAEHFERYQKRGNLTLLACDGTGAIVGFADLWQADEPEPFGRSLDVECVDYFLEYYYLGLETVLLEEAEKVARAAGLPALDIGTNTSSGDYPSLRRRGMEVFYEYDHVTCRCALGAPAAAFENRVIRREDGDLSGLVRASHWSPTDFMFRDGGQIVELSWDDRRAILELWGCEFVDGKWIDIPVPDQPPRNTELYVEPDVLKSSPDLSRLLQECSRLAGRAGAERIPLPCPSSLVLDGEWLDVEERRFAYSWFRKRLAE